MNSLPSLQSVITPTDLGDEIRRIKRAFRRKEEGDVRRTLLANNHGEAYTYFTDLKDTFSVIENSRESLRFE